MTMNLLRQIASSPLPACYYRPEDIDRIRILSAAGLIIAFAPPSAESAPATGTPTAAQVLAVTQKGREELARFEYPKSPPSSWRVRLPWSSGTAPQPKDLPHEHTNVS